jgi:nitrous oxidase accessory protein NosD
MRKIAMALVLAGSLLAFGEVAAQAGTATTLYVSPSGTHGAADTSCSTARYSNINAAITAARSGGTVVVCKGTYKTQAIVRKPLRLIGKSGAVINAKGQSPLTVGHMKLPGSIGIGVLGTKNVRVSGFKVVNAGFDAILVGLSSHVVVIGNVLQHNGDVGVDINGSSSSEAVSNISEYNAGGGFLVTDDIGPSSYNVVSYNVASHNPGGCGVILAGHSTFGVTHNLVAGNLLTDNGTLKSAPDGPGAGVVIATEVPGEKVADNTVIDNTISGNGLAGVTIHAHLPGQNLNGNRIIGNVIGTNNILGDVIDLATSPTSKKNVAVPDLRTTGILVGSASRISVLIRNNHISRNYYGIFLEGVGKVVHASLSGNHFSKVSVHVKRVVVS